MPPDPPTNVHTWSQPKGREAISYKRTNIWLDVDWTLRDVISFHEGTLTKNQNSHQALSAKQSAATTSCQLTVLSWASCGELGWLLPVSKSLRQQEPRMTGREEKPEAAAHQRHQTPFWWGELQQFVCFPFLCSETGWPHGESCSELPKQPEVSWGQPTLFTHPRAPSLPTWNNATLSLKSISSSSPCPWWRLHNFNTQKFSLFSTPRTDHHLHYEVVNCRIGGNIPRNKYNTIVTICYNI